MKKSLVLLFVVAAIGCHAQPVVVYQPGLIPSLVDSVVGLVFGRTYIVNGGSVCVQPQVVAAPAPVVYQPAVAAVPQPVYASPAYVSGYSGYYYPSYYGASYYYAPYGYYRRYGYYRGYYRPSYHHHHHRHHR